ncbi:MAG: hypothetical protein ABSB19_09445 [Methylomonas sp.]|jgi:hypothetical protein
MNSARLKCIAVFSIFAIIGFGPISPGCLIGMYIVVVRPRWFLDLACNIYEHAPLPDFNRRTATVRIRCFLSLLVLFIMDIAPVPVTPSVAFVIILGRPMWFYRTVIGVYGGIRS